MSTSNDTNLPPAIAEVFSQFLSVLRADEKIDKTAIDNLEKLIRSGPVPKPDEIHSALFPIKEGDL